MRRGVRLAVRRYVIYFFMRLLDYWAPSALVNTKRKGYMLYYDKK